MSIARPVCNRLVPVALLLVLAGCSALQPDPHLAAFTTQLTGMNEVPPVGTSASGRVDAVLNKNTGLFRWRLTYSGLSGPATAAHFHGPASIGRNAAPSLTMASSLQSPSQGRATLSAAQSEDLLAGRWYANIHTVTHPGGEIRGQMALVD
jgi:hypothetical protein